MATKTTDSKQTQREIAQLLYLNSRMMKKDIALKLGVAEQTVSRWAKQDNWDVLKDNLLTSRKQRLSELYAELREFNRMIQDKEGYKVATSKEADARRKLIIDIKELETKYSLQQTITVGQDFCDYVKTIDEALANRVLDIYNAFVHQKIEDNKWQS